MKFSSLTKKIGFIQYGGIAFLIALAAVAYIWLSPNYKDVLVTVRLADRDMMWLDNGSPLSSVMDSLQVGMKKKDAFGRVAAEVIHINAFDQPKTESPYASKKTVYVTLRLRASHNNKTGQYRYQGTILQVGEWVRLSIQSTMINGLTVRIPAGASDEPTWVTVKAQVKSEGPFIFEPFSETTGVDKAIADAIVVGDTVKDSDGNILAQVLDKTVTPAVRTTWDLYGNVFNRPHPRKYDVIMTVRLAVRKIGSGLYYLDTAPIKINSLLPLFLSRIDIEPRVIEIISE